MNQREAGVGEVLEGEIETMMAAPAVGQQRVGMALAGLHRQPGPAQTMDPVEIFEVVQAFVDDHGHAGGHLVERVGIGPQVAGGGLLDIVQRR